MKALLVIDMQNVFVEKGAAIEVERIRDNIAAYKEFIAACREKGMLIIYTRHCYDAKKNPIEARLFPQLPDFKKGAHGWEIYDALKPGKDDIIVDKTRYDAFFGTNLHETLQSHDVDTVVITGTMTEICCDSTARGAMMRDYEMVFCSDLTFTNDPAVQEGTLNRMKSHFGTVMKSKEILRQ